MANLQIKNINEAFYGQIKALADSENRSISQHERDSEEIIDDIKRNRLNSTKLSNGF